jgi:hypothetical protein
MGERGGMVAYFSKPFKKYQTPVIYF